MMEYWVSTYQAEKRRPHRLSHLTDHFYTTDCEDHLAGSGCVVATPNEEEAFLPVPTPPADLEKIHEALQQLRAPPPPPPELVVVPAAAEEPPVEANKLTPDGCLDVTTWALDDVCDAMRDRLQGAAADVVNIVSVTRRFKALTTHVVVQEDELRRVFHDNFHLAVTESQCRALLTAIGYPDGVPVSSIAKLAGLFVEQRFSFPQDDDDPVINLVSPDLKEDHKTTFTSSLSIGDFVMTEDETVRSLPPIQQQQQHGPPPPLPEVPGGPSPPPSGVALSHEELALKEVVDNRACRDLMRSRSQNTRRLLM